MNKGILVVLAGALVAAMSFILTAKSLLPGFVTPFVIVLFGLYLVFLAFK